MIDKNQFTKDTYGWELKNTDKVFLGKPIEVNIDTKTDSDHPDREIYNEQIETLKIIFSNWENLAQTIEKEILNYENISKEELQKVLDAPRIWLGMDDETNQPLENNHWSFVLGVSESEDFGWHVEFNGVVHEETWAGG